MYVHIGDEILIRTSDIIVILDKQNISLEQIKSIKAIKETEHDLFDPNIKSIIITENDVFLSTIASVTLKKRCRISTFQEFNNDFLIT